MSAFEIPFRSLWARLAAWIIPAAGVGLRGALILSAALMFASGIYFNWFSDESPIPGGPDDGLFQYSVVAVPQDAMAATLAAHATHAASLANMDGVVAAGVGLNALGQPSVKVYVREIGVAALPATLDAGVPVSVEVIGEVWAWGHAPGTQQALEASDATPASRFERPVPIGVSSGHPSITAGTIGARVTDGSKIYALSNNHVFAAENQAKIDDKILQPGPVDGGIDPTDAFGTLADFEPVKFGFGASNTMDAAIALSSAEDLGKATLGDGYGEPLAQTVKAKISLGVKKYGRTTGFTQGKVDAIMATVNVRYRQGSARFVNQILIKPGGFSAGGDSGSLVVANGGKDDNKPVGLVFAGSTLVSIANPIDPVLERFGVTVDGN